MEADFSDVLSKKVELADFKFYRYRKSSLTIAFNKQEIADSELLINNKIIGESLNDLKEKADFVIIDTPPISVSADAISIAGIADTTVLVVRTDCVSVEDINEVILNISDAGANFEGCILNDVYKPFTLFGQMGVDERGYYGSKNYYGYSKPIKSPSNTDENFSANSLDSLNRNE